MKMLTRIYFYAKSEKQIYEEKYFLTYHTKQNTFSSINASPFSLDFQIVSWKYNLTIIYAV